MTTRPARPGEEDGVDYHFVDRVSFERAAERGDLVEWAEYNGNLYGTPRDSIEGPLAAGEDVLLDIEILGAKNVRRAFPEAVMIYILPPSMDALEERLRGRGDTSDEEVAGRLAVAAWQMEEAQTLFEHFVVNDRLDAAIEEVAGILAAPRPPQAQS
jgi:guanylate kinase